MWKSSNAACSSGFKQAFLTGAGAMCADATYLTLIFFGLTAFLNNDLMKIVLGIAGSFILIYLGAVSAKDFFRKVPQKMTSSGVSLKIPLSPVSRWPFPLR